MTSLADKETNPLVKLVYIGDSGTGKTGSLVSLIEAGYQVRIVDLDNGTDALYHQVKRRCPDRLASVEFETLRDRYVSTPGGPIVSAPKAMQKAINVMNKWPDGSTPAEWGPSHILVIDSLTSLGRAAYWWARGMNPGAKDPRNWYFQGQQAIANTLDMLTSPDFNTNLIVISHVTYTDPEMEGGLKKGYPSALGKALGPTIGKNFNTLILAESRGQGKNVRRRIITLPTSVIDLKASSPEVEGEYPLESGLASIFHTLTETQNV